MNKVKQNEHYIEWVMSNYEKSVIAFHMLRETLSITEDEYQNYIKLEADKMFDLIERI